MTEDSNAKFYKLLNELKNVSGTPLTLNTSFNLRGEEIVCTPENALDCFLRSEMDYLVINNFWIEKKRPADDRFVCLTNTIGLGPKKVFSGAS